MAILDFSVSGQHGFGSVTQVCFGISVSNFMCMFFVAVGRSLMIVSYIAFKMAALWFWTMFNCNPPIAHCYPLLWGGGILVDHWSTISNFQLPGRHFSVKMPSYQYTIWICMTKINMVIIYKCKTFLWPSYLCNGNPVAGKTFIQGPGRHAIFPSTYCCGAGYKLISAKST